MNSMRDLLRTRRYEALRAILKQARTDVGLSQAQTAALIGRPQTYISDIETDVRRLDVVEFLRLAKALKLAPATVIAKVNGVRDRY